MHIPRKVATESTNLAEHFIFQHFLKLGNEIVAANITQLLDKKDFQIAGNRST
jgi:hypothetical protein